MIRDLDAWSTFGLRGTKGDSVVAKSDHGTTQQLVLRIHGGDAEAFNLLFMRYFPRIKLLVRIHMFDKLKAQVEDDDVVQEIYMELYRNFHKFEYTDPPIPSSNG